MTNQDYGRIVFAFMLAYTIMNAVSGPLIDRLGTKAGYALTVAWWSAAEILHAFASARSAWVLADSPRLGRGRELARRRQSGCRMVPG